MRADARRALIPDRTDWLPIDAENIPPKTCSSPSSPGCAAINADIPASEAVSHTAMPTVIPAVHHSPARTEREATRITWTTSGPGAIQTASQTPVRVSNDAKDTQQ